MHPNTALAAVAQHALAARYRPPAAPVAHELQHLFPAAVDMHGFLDVTDAVAEAMIDAAERDAKRRNLLTGMLLALIDGRDTNALRIPRPDAGCYTRTHRSSLMWSAILGAHAEFRNAASFSLIANLRLEADGVRWALNA